MKDTGSVMRLPAMRASLMSMRTSSGCMTRISARSIPSKAAHSERVASPREEAKESKESQRARAVQHAGFSGHAVKEEAKARRVGRAMAQLLRQTLPKKRSKKRRLRMMRC